MALEVIYEGNATRTRRRALANLLHPDTGNKDWYRQAETSWGQFATARLDGQVVGYVYWETSRTRGFQPTVTVVGLYGTPKAGIRGVGRALMGEAARQAQAIGAELKVTGMVKTARSFYATVGAEMAEYSSVGRWSDEARDLLAGSGRRAATLAAAGTGNS